MTSYLTAWTNTHNALARKMKDRNGALKGAMQMETVEVMIKIPKVIYDDLSNKKMLDEFVKSEVHFYDFEIGKSIQNGTVLPKEHGKLIDADKLGLTDFEIVMCDGDYKKVLKMLCEKIENAPTILDAEVQG